MIYAGIGSRKTPKEVLTLMTALAVFLAELGLTLRSGGAPGADSAFEKGCDRAAGLKEIFLPWKKFNYNQSPLFEVSSEAIELSRIYYPTPELFEIKPYIAKLMGRNAQQVLGQNLDSPVDFVVCWTPDGCETQQDRTKETGGTGQAIAIADAYSIPVYNLKNEDARENILVHARVIEEEKRTNEKGDGSRSSR